MTSADDHDPVDPHPGLQPPADPWLTDSPTSPFSHHTPYAGAASPADTMPEGFASTPVPPDAEPRRRSRRPVRWILAGLGALAVVMISVLVVDQFGGDPGGDNPAARRPTVTSPTPTVAAQPPRPGTSRTATAQPGGVGTDATSRGATGTYKGEPVDSAPAPGGSVVVYEVTVSGSGNVGSVQYTDQDGEMIRLGGIPLPWRTSFTQVGRQPLILIAQRKSGGDLGPLTCTVTVDGKLTDSVTGRGRYAAAMC